MIINSPIFRPGSLVETVSNTSKQGANQNNNGQRTQATLDAQPAQLVSVSAANLSDRIDLRVLKVSDATFQQQRALSVYLATEFSGDDSEPQPLVNITA